MIDVDGTIVLSDSVSVGGDARDSHAGVRDRSARDAHDNNDNNDELRRTNERDDLDTVTSPLRRHPFSQSTPSDDVPRRHGSSAVPEGKERGGGTTEFVNLVSDESPSPSPERSAAAGSKYIVIAGGITHSKYFSTKGELEAFLAKPTHKYACPATGVRVDLKLKNAFLKKGTCVGVVCFTDKDVSDTQKIMQANERGIPIISEAEFFRRFPGVNVVERESKKRRRASAGASDPRPNAGGARRASDGDPSGARRASARRARTPRATLQDLNDAAVEWWSGRNELRCPRCSIGSLVVRHGKWGMFVGCTKFHDANIVCKHKRPLSSAEETLISEVDHKDFWQKKD